MITYQTSNRHPETLPSATIYLDGLLCLSFDGPKKCTVGVNKVRGGHAWKLIVDQESENDQEPNTRILELRQKNSKLREAYIDVAGGVTHGAKVFNGNDVLIPGTNSRRFNLESYWIDLEGPRGHNQRVQNDKNTLWPRFYINEGLFCASKLSTRSFALKNSNPRPLIKPLGQIALEMVADIFLDTSNPHRKIELKLSYETGQKIIPLDHTKRHRIYITNDCDSGGPPDQIDFHLHYNSFSGAFNGSPGMSRGDQFQLISNTASAKSESGLAQTGDNRSDATDDASDRAPCMPTAAGQTHAFNA